MVRWLAAIAALILFVGIPIGELAAVLEWLRFDTPIGWLAAIVAILSILLGVTYRSDSAPQKRNRER